MTTMRPYLFAPVRLVLPAFFPELKRLAAEWRVELLALAEAILRPLMLAGKEQVKKKKDKLRPEKPARADKKSGKSKAPDEPGLEDDEGEEEELDEDGGEPELGEEGPEDEKDEEEAYQRPRPASEWSGGSGEEDVELISLFLRGDNDAFTRLVIKYQNKVHNLCYRIVGDKDEAKDMAQEVFVTAHKSLKNFRGESLFSTWIYRVTVNHCKNRIKYLGRRRYFQTLSIDQPQQVDDGELYYEPEDESPDAEMELASEEIQTLVQDAIASLDADHRLVVVLRDIQDLSYEEIADIVGIKVGTVKSRIHRARNDLKKKLEGKIKL